MSRVLIRLAAVPRFMIVVMVGYPHVLHVRLQGVWRGGYAQQSIGGPLGEQVPLGLVLVHPRLLSRHQGRRYTSIGLHCGIT